MKGSETPVPSVVVGPDSRTDTTLVVLLWTRQIILFDRGLSIR